MAIRAAYDKGGRSYLTAPMLWNDRGIGALYVGSLRVDAFSPKDAALLQTFAEQAVVAIQNARLFKQTQEAREQAEWPRPRPRPPTRPRAPSWPP